MALNSWSKLRRGTTSAEAISKVQDVQDSLDSTNVETLSRITRHHHPPTGYLQATGHFPSAVSIQQLRLLVSKIVTEVLSPPGHSSVQRTSQPGLSYSPSGLKQRSMELISCRVRWMCQNKIMKLSQERSMTTEASTVEHKFKGRNLVQTQLQLKIGSKLHFRDNSTGRVARAFKVATLCRVGESKKRNLESQVIQKRLVREVKIEAKTL